ncbi:cyclic nucleotide-binding protein [Bordetella genomosp. 10]|uniref:Cyclic nucleotide-binding protein n=1 Tax=Bordetella genomosp. 10 TaxID=1416804 RepID=A0A261RZ39_9BORD|nr:Crp/Fnr family transcriptional regulator [Bordetella genomosp. 10]OZI29810.1 cyclic nucleotide-binding protein [Bordetella genomosp. 10]
MTKVNSLPEPLRIVLALRAHEWFGDVDDAALAGLARCSRWVEFEPGDMLLSEGQEATSCLLVCHGKLQGLRYTPEGGDKVFGHVGPGGFLSVLNLFEATPRHLHCARAIEAGAACLLNGAALRRLCGEHAGLAGRLLRHAANLVRHHTDQIDWLTSSSAEERLAEYVLRAGRPKANQPINLPLTHSQIAVKLGMRAETLSRIFAKWRREGYISDGRGMLRVLRPERLEALTRAGHADKPQA